MDSPSSSSSSSSSSDRNSRNNICNILTVLGFKDTPESRKLDPWMIAVLARQQQHEACSANNPSILLLPDINHSESPLKNHHNTNYKRRHSNDHDSQNYEYAVVGKRQKNVTSKKQQNAIAPRSGLVKKFVRAPAHPVEKQLPVQLRNMIFGRMGGSDLLFVIEKALTWTDVNPGQSRFSIPERQVANQFLSIGEKANVKMGIDAMMLICKHDYQPGSEEIKEKKINLTLWALRSSNNYVLNQHWNAIVQEQKLRKNMLVQLWTFRVQSQLYFFLVKL